jgi:hypothetical protein
VRTFLLAIWYWLLSRTTLQRKEISSSTKFVLEKDDEHVLYIATIGTGDMNKIIEHYCFGAYIRYVHTCSVDDYGTYAVGNTYRMHKYIHVLREGGARVTG